MGQDRSFLPTISRRLVLLLLVFQSLGRSTNYSSSCERLPTFGDGGRASTRNVFLFSCFPGPLFLFAAFAGRELGPAELQLQKDCK